jgi:hypothetical protein
MPKPELRSLNVDMKLGVLNTIAKSVYSGIGVKIREAVSNAQDHGAKNFIVYLDRESKTLSLFDDGSGISISRFQEIFENLGYGTDRDKQELNSYFGLGLMSVLRLGKKVTIYSRTPDEKGQVNRLSVDSEAIFAEENEKQSLSFMKDKCLQLDTSDLESRAAQSSLTVEDIRKVLSKFPTTFTEILVEDLRDIGEFSASFSEDLRKHMPLAPDTNDPFLNTFKDPNDKKKILDLLATNEKFCPTINMFFGDGEAEFHELHKYFPDFRDDVEFNHSRVEFGKRDDFAYYYVYSLSDMELESKTSEETGFWVRNKNFLVKAADYFQQPGNKAKKLLSEPLKNWFFCEIFHKNMNPFLVVTRNEYVWDNDKFKDFRKQVMELVKPLDSKLRREWKRGKNVADAVVSPLVEAADPRKSPFVRFNQTLASIGYKSDGKEAAEILATLKSKRTAELENDAHRIDVALAKNKSPVVLADDSEINVAIDPSITEAIGYTQTIEEGTSRSLLKISPALFTPKRVTFLGHQFEIYYVCAKDEAPGISVNVDTGKIYINPFNQDLSRYTISFIDIYLAIQIADAKSKTKSEMKELLTQLLGNMANNNNSAQRYWTPLHDDLRRKLKI